MQILSKDSSLKQLGESYKLKTIFRDNNAQNIWQLENFRFHVK